MNGVFAHCTLALMISFRTVWIRGVPAHLAFLLSLLPDPAPPSDPRIPAPSTGYPFFTGSTSVSLTCVSDTPGYPPASYTWTRTAGGRPGSGGTLTFDTVTSDLHNRTVSCRASNDFTVDKDRPLVEASRRLQVYCEYRDRACGRWLLKNCIESVVHTAHLLTEAFVPFIRTLSAA